MRHLTQNSRMMADRARFLGAVSFAALSSILSLSAQAIERTSYAPVPFLVDEEKVISNLIFEIETTSYGIPFDLFEARSGGEATADAFVQLVKAMKRQDREAVYATSVTYGKPEGEAFKEFADAYVDAFSDAFASLEVIRRYNFDEDTLISWQINFEGQPWRRIFRFYADDASSPTYWADRPLVSSERYLYSLLADIEQLELEGQLEITDQPPNRRFRQALPDMPGYWHFDGFAVDNWDPFASGVAVPDHPATRLYEAAMRDFATGNWPAFAAHYTPYSRAKILDDPDGENIENFNNFRDSVLRLGRRVFFILNADPIYLIFHERPSDGLIQYDTVYRDPETGLWSLTNFLVEGFMDDIAKDREFFVDPVLGSLRDATTYPLLAQAPVPAVTPVPSASAQVSSPGAAAEQTDSPAAEPDPEGDERSSNLWWILIFLAVGLVAILFYLKQKK